MCEQCRSLRCFYDEAVSAYTKAVRNMRGTIGDDFHEAFREVRRSYDICLSVRDALNAHWNEEHGPNRQRPTVV